jgi:hypothetical protein
MSETETRDRLLHSTTRRKVIKSGVKLAYAAPLVAGSIKLSESGALAALSGGPFTCPAGAVDVCGPYTACGTTSGNNPCVCHRTASGATLCGGFGACRPGEECNSDEDCGVIVSAHGEAAPGFCHVGTCCTPPAGFRGFCAPRCQ